MSLKTVYKTTFLCLALAVVAGCSYHVEDYASQGDWDMVGYTDGVKGKTHRSSEQLSALSEQGAVDLNAYAEGYLRGNAEFCNPNHAYQIGLTGTYYEGVCEGTADAQKFRMEWQRGWDESNQ